MKILKPNNGSSSDTPVVRPPSPISKARVVDRTLDQTRFLRSLFSCLDREGVRYCVLQRWDSLLEELATDHDVDLAVHPEDAGKLPRVFGALWSEGYQPIQFLNHAVNSYAFIFGWLEGLTLKSVMVDIAFEHRQCGLIWKSGQELVAHRQKPGEFWVADPETEFSYLLVKKLLKDNWSTARSHRFQQMVERMGEAKAAQVIGQLFGTKRKKLILQACIEGTPGTVLRPLRREFLLRALARNPVNLLRYAVADSLRLGRRFLMPTGATLVLSGQDSVKKSALLVRLVDVLVPAFGCRKVYWGAGETVAQQDFKFGGREPVWNKQAATKSSNSLLEVLRSFARFWSRYVFRIRPLLIRTGLVVFDRHFLDECFGDCHKQTPGTKWLVQTLCRLVPRPDLLLRLDAGEVETNSRVRGGSRDAFEISNAEVQMSPGNGLERRGLKTALDMDEVVQGAAQSFLDRLSQRFQTRHPQWLSSSAS